MSLPEINYKSVPYDANHEALANPTKNHYKLWHNSIAKRIFDVKKTNCLHISSQALYHNSYMIHL